VIVAVALDVLIAASILWLGWRLLADADLVRGAVLFIGFGLLAALAWARLDAPDIALAEAAIGAALTGVLVLDAAAALQRRQGQGSDDPVRPLDPFVGRGLARASVAVAVAIAALLLWAIADLPDGGVGLAADVDARIGETGVSHGVTAVLLAFRAWDTLLEVAVLMGAVVAVLAVARSWGPPTPGLPTIDPLALWFGRLLVPVAVLAAGYVLWAGGSAPGGAFQAGALLAGAVLLAALTGALPRTSRPGPLRLASAVGVAGFLAATLVSALAGPALLRWPVAADYELIVVIEATIAVAVGVGLAAVFFAIGGSEERRR
jgi:multisubunit Na+/H+ antiporter MnhB subunit